MKVESFYYYSTLNFEITAALVFQLEVYYKVDKLLTGLNDQQSVTTARRDSNKTTLCTIKKENAHEARASH